MRAALHILATLAVVPYVVLAIGFVILGHSIASGSLLSFFDTLLMHAAWILPWGLIGFACAIFLVAVLGMVPRFQRLGAACLCLLAGASLVVIIIGSTSRVDSAELLFLLPCMSVLAFGAWLTVAARPSIGSP